MADGSYLGQHFEPLENVIITHDIFDNTAIDIGDSYIITNDNRLYSLTDQVNRNVTKAKFVSADVRSVCIYDDFNQLFIVLKTDGSLWFIWGLDKDQPDGAEYSAKLADGVVSFKNALDSFNMVFGNSDFVFFLVKTDGSVWTFRPDKSEQSASFFDLFSSFTPTERIQYGDIKVIIDGRPSTFDVPPFI